MVNNQNIRLGFLASHNGSTMQAIIDACIKESLNAKPVVLITNNSRSGAICRAKKIKMPFYHLSSKTHSNPDDLDQEITKILKLYSVDLVLLTGYMKKLGNFTLKNFSKRILNSHPALLPNYGGRGMYGTKVHQKVLESGDKFTGSTIHFVESNYDSGQIISQSKISILPNDCIDTLEKKVKFEEKKLYVNSIRKIIDKL